jgi:lysozyme family protein
VTQATWIAWAADNARDVALQDATKADLATLLHRRFWVPAGQGLPSGVNLMVFDFGLTSGPARSVRFLQGIVDVRQDGACGPVTQAAAANANPADLCQRLHDRQAAFYRADPLASRFPGWFRRNDDRLALTLASLTPATS